MRKFRIFINTALLLLIFSSFGFSRIFAEENILSEDDLMKEEEQINLLLTKQLKEGWETKNIDLYMSAFSEKVTTQNVDGQRWLNYNEMKQQGENFFKNINSISYTITHSFVKINPDGKAASVVLNVTFLYSSLGKEEKLETGNILELLKENNEWKIIKSYPLEGNKVFAP